MAAKIVVDSGPLVALFDHHDQHHRRAVDLVQHLTGEIISNLAVVTEVCYLLDFSRRARSDFLGWVGRGAVTLVSLEVVDFDRILQLMDKYDDLPIDFADASLVAICERLEIRDIASVDRDFGIYRYRNRQPFRNVFFAG
jgi:predicted nucleic acid-binding protein